MKKSRSAVFLMELILVILFFSLSAAVTLQLFVAAHRQEQQSTLCNRALLLAENTAERFAAQGVSTFDSAAGWQCAQETDGICRYTLPAHVSGLTAVVTLKTTTDGLQTGALEVWDKTVSLCCLPLGRYVPGTEGVS